MKTYWVYSRSTRTSLHLVVSTSAIPPKGYGFVMHVNANIKAQAMNIVTMILGEHTAFKNSHPSPTDLHQLNF